MASCMSFLERNNNNNKNNNVAEASQSELEQKRWPPSNVVMILESITLIIELKETDNTRGFIAKYNAGKMNVKEYYGIGNDRLSRSGQRTWEYIKPDTHVLSSVVLVSSTIDPLAAHGRSGMTPGNAIQYDVIDLMEI